VTARPHIIFIMADDLGYADLACYGQTDYPTPHLDRLAAQGMRFTQAYANSPLCTNTRVALMTGRYQYRYKLGLTEPLRHRSKDDPEMGLPPGAPTLPGLLAAAGYDTALIGKWHLGALPRFGPLRSGYQSFYGVMGGFTGYFTHIGDGGAHDFYEGEAEVQTQGYVTHQLTDRALACIRQAHTRGRPLFLSLHYTAPHWPWSAPSNETQARLQENDPTQVAEGGSPRIYAEMVGELDAGVGRVMDTLQELGMASNTLVIFTSDNGGERYSNNWPFVGRKMDLLEGGLRVPQILWQPGAIAPGQVSDQVCITMDLSATCLDAAGLSENLPKLDGRSLLPLLHGRQANQPRTLFWRMRNRGQQALRQGDWKYLRVNGKDHLFDLSHDWRERACFAASRTQLLDELKALWQSWDNEMLPLPTDPEGPRLMNLADMLW
jgi:arylsulfatase A-like enzyme